uniref:Transposon Ty3-I Gag-Pol polyprotein n=1 Tax=Cajanus cajan TaxID=3821 RepID=A0A151SQ73_CAJCA|nr:Transposon Ty3-I Gag-Pol polyprotein [Cajanus cajan]
MVRKSSEKWRMCTNFIDLNKACPKDSYPLPNIDCLVDGASGYELLSFMDAYSGYNQIRMHPADEDKTAFIADQANYCYKVMPFGLKNAGASWVKELPRVLWSYHTTVHSSTRDTPFNLVYGTDAMIPIEITKPSVRTTAFSEEESDQGRRVDLDLIAETREKARINQVAAHRRAAFKYNTKVVPRDFVVGDLVLKRAQATQMRNKLSPKWVGPYKIDDVVGKGAYRLRTLDGGMIPRTWNATNLRFYYS